MGIYGPRPRLAGRLWERLRALPSDAAVYISGTGSGSGERLMPWAVGAICALLGGIAVIEARRRGLLP